jgi:hypothetical protein
MIKGAARILPISFKAIQFVLDRKRKFRVNPGAFGNIQAI